MRAMRAVTGGWAIVLAAAGLFVGLTQPGTVRAAGEWSADMDCSACHVVEAASLSEGPSPHGSLTCSTCHSDEKFLSDVHKGVDASSTLPKKLKKAKVDAETCLACHGGAAATPARDAQVSVEKASEAKDAADANAAAEKDADPKADAAAKDSGSTDSDSADKNAGWEALAALTADSEALVDAEGTVVNPHALPEGAGHEAISCTDCHKVHTEADPVKTATAKCRSCHHEDVFECYTCHD